MNPSFHPSLWCTMKFGLVVYKLHFQIPLPDGLTILQIGKKEEERLNSPASSSTLHHSTGEDSIGCNLLFLLALMELALPHPLISTGSSHASRTHPIFPIWVPAGLAPLADYQPSLLTCIISSASTRAQNINKLCFPQRSEHQALKTPFQDLIICPTEAPPPSIQLLVTLPLPSLVMSESHL